MLETMKSVKLMEKLTEQLLAKGIDFEVTWKQGVEGVESHVRMFDGLTDKDIGVSSKEKIEDALIDILTDTAMRSIIY